MQPVISIAQVRKSYPGKKPVEALKGVSLSINPGEIFAMLGPNGAGKTTLLKILLGLIAPTSGEAFIEGYPVHKAQARQQVGYVPETNKMIDDLPAHTLLHFLAMMSGLEKSGLKIKVEQMLQRVGLGDVQRPVRTFSKGMRRRLALAQALLHEPQVLLLDEPTDGLDPEERQKIFALLKALRDDGKTIFLCSHVLSEVAQLCDRYVIFYQGTIIAEAVMADTIQQSLETVYTESINKHKMTATHA